MTPACLFFHALPEPRQNAKAHCWSIPTTQIPSRALEMPLEERRERHNANLTALARNGGTVWSSRFLQSLAGSQTINEPLPGEFSLAPFSPSRPTVAARR